MTLLHSNILCWVPHLQSISSPRGHDHDEHVYCIVNLHLWLAQTHTLYNHYIVTSWNIEEKRKRYEDRDGQTNREGERDRQRERAKVQRKKNSRKKRSQHEISADTPIVILEFNLTESRCQLQSQNEDQIISNKMKLSSTILKSQHCILHLLHTEWSHRQCVRRCLLVLLLLGLHVRSTHRFCSAGPYGSCHLERR